MADIANTSAYPVAMNLLKAGLGFFDSQIPESLAQYLESLLEASATALAERGIHITPGNIADDMLQEMYAEWLYRKKATGAAMPDMLRNEIRTRQVGKAVSECEEVPL